MSPCPESEVEALVFGGLGPEAASRVRAHLAVCDRCRDEHAELTRERRLFAQRAWSASSEPLPDIEAIFSRASEPRRGVVRRAIASALVGAPGVGRSTKSQILVAAAAGLLLVGLVRNHVEPVSSRPVVGAHVAFGNAPTSPRQHGAVEETQEPCSEEEAVCREARGFALRSERVMTFALPSERSSVECSTEQASSVVPGVFRPSRPDTESMCVAGAI